MTYLSMHRTIARGGAAALLVLGAALPAGAQNARVIRGRAVKDTVLLRVLNGSRMQLDSITVLMRALDVEPLTSTQSMKIRMQLDSLMMMLAGERDLPEGTALVHPRIPARIIVAGPGGMGAFGGEAARGWIGLTTGPAPHTEWVDDGQFIRYFEHPAIISVDRDSPAQKAGIAPGDVLVAYDGVDLVGHDINITELLKPERKLGITVRRDGETRDYTVVVARAPNRIVYHRLDEGDLPPFPPSLEMNGPLARALAEARAQAERVAAQRMKGTPPGGSLFFFRANMGVFGASLSAVGPELAKTLKIEPGVLVNEVPRDTPASRSGLRVGDVIVSVAGRPVRTVEEVQSVAMTRGDNGRLTIQVIRDRKPRTITMR